MSFKSDFRMYAGFTDQVLEVGDPFSDWLWAAGIAAILRVNFGWKEHTPENVLGSRL
jgi:hypothetical protein